MLAFAESRRLPEEPGQEEPKAKRVDSDPWPEPEPLGGKLPPVMPMLPEMLPDAFRPYAEDIVARMQVPLNFPAVALVATFAGVVGRRAAIQPKERDPWRVIPNLWGGIVAKPGQLKSPVLSAVRNRPRPSSGIGWRMMRLQ